MLAALVLPALAFLLWFALPLGWVADPGYEHLAARLALPAVRAALLVVVVLALFHWAHRFRFTLYDGLQLSHLWGLIAAVCYGGATLLSALAAWVLVGGF